MERITLVLPAAAAARTKTPREEFRLRRLEKNPERNQERQNRRGNKKTHTSSFLSFQKVIEGLRREPPRQRRDQRQGKYANYPEEKQKFSGFSCWAPARRSVGPVTPRRLSGGHLLPTIAARHQTCRYSNHRTSGG